LSPYTTLFRSLELAVGGDLQILVHTREVPDLAQGVLLREGGGGGVGVLVGGFGAGQDSQTVGEVLLERGVDLLGRPVLRLGVVVREQVAPVFGEHIQRAVLELGHVHLALADLELPGDGVPVGLQDLREQLGDDLVGVVGLGADDQVAALTASVASAAVGAAGASLLGFLLVLL